MSSFIQYEATISRAAWDAIYNLCREYLTQGGAGQDNAAVEEALEALSYAQRIELAEPDAETEVQQ